MLIILYWRPKGGGHGTIPPLNTLLIASAGNTALFEEMLQRWRAVGNNVSDMTGPRFKPQTSRSRRERVTARIAS